MGVFERRYLKRNSTQTPQWYDFQGFTPMIHRRIHASTLRHTPSNPWKSDHRQWALQIASWKDLQDRWKILSGNRGYQQFIIRQCLSLQGDIYHVRSWWPNISGFEESCQRLIWVFRHKPRIFDHNDARWNFKEISPWRGTHYLRFLTQ